MKKEISRYVIKCQTCQQVKVEHKKPAGKLQSLPILECKLDHVFAFVIIISSIKVDNIFIHLLVMSL